MSSAQHWKRPIHSLLIVMLLHQLKSSENRWDDEPPLAHIHLVIFELVFFLHLWIPPCDV